MEKRKLYSYDYSLSMVLRMLPRQLSICKAQCSCLFEPCLPSGLNLANKTAINRMLIPMITVYAIGFPSQFLT